MPDFIERDSWTQDEIAEFKNQTQFKALIEPFKAKAHLVAEGDSWFDYPVGTDIIDCLRAYDYAIDNFATHGDTLEDMIYGTSITDDFEPRTSSIRRVLKRIGKVKPRALLFSGGGNDIAGDEFSSFLNHKESNLPDLRQDYLQFMVDQVFRKAYEDLISKVAAASPDTYVLTHGYGHTIPTGKGVKFIFVSWTGPWLLPALSMKRITDPIRQKEIVATLINALNDLLQQLSSQHPKFRYVDLRPLLDPYSDWVNELHLRNSAYSRVAERLHREIQSLP